MSENLLGAKVGHFRVVHLLGKGGMGEVYVGYDEKLERRVALKAISAAHRPNMEAKARLLREARVLSQIHHPNICQIFDYIEGENTDVLVLELVEGKKLSRIDEPKLDTRKRLSLAIELAGALAAAHGKGIIHRDLKPDNVMLDDKGHVKILDFGLSRSLAEEETVTLAAGGAANGPPPIEEHTSGLGSPKYDGDPSLFQTKYGSILGTLGYMSPEQARGEPATSASDVYSLGFVLQELFTGEPAFGRGGSLQERLERAKNGESQPVKGLDPDLTSLLERMKSLIPAARPTAVEALDRLRWIEEKPARKRWRFLAATALVLLVATAIGAPIQSLLISRERNRANQEADQAKQTLAFLTGTFEVANPRKGKGPSATAAEIIDYATTKLDETKGQPLLQARLLTTLSEVYDEMGLYDAAEPLARRALQIREKALGAEDPDVAASLNHLANIWQKQGRLAEAEPIAQRSMEIRERALGPDHPDVARSLNNLAIIWWRQGKLAEAEPLLQRSLQIQETAYGPGHPGVATALNNLATLYADLGKFAQAEQLYRRSLETWEMALGPNHPDVATSLNNLATIYADQGKLTEAEPLLQRSLQIREKSLGPDHPDVAISLNNIADIYINRGRLAEAEVLFKRSLAIKEKALGPNHPDVAFALYNLGVVALKRGRRDEALAYMRGAIPRFVGTAYWKALVEEDPDIAPLRTDREFQRIVTELRKSDAAKEGSEKK